MLATACGAPPCPCARSRLLPPASIGSSYGSSARVRSTRRRAPRRAAVVRCGLLPVDPWAPTMDSQSVASQLFAVSLFPYLGFLYFMTRSKTAPGLTLFGFYFLLAFVGATSTRYFPLPTLVSHADLSFCLSPRSGSCFEKIMSVPLIVFMLFHAPVFIPGAVPAGIYGNCIVIFFPTLLYSLLLLMLFLLTDAIISIATKVHYGTSLSNVDWLHGSAESLLTLTNLFIVLGLRGALRKLEEEDTKESISEASQDSKEKSSV
ncbi:hypothetical protein HU200_026430 [Digitaria exilis]|uniref:Uncharacterized protein n=1 Tax=Digitaria exilis TaxID=1010633 RepID=A0A835EUB7_9POAL|nr:hypothetical protein HU200_026430 [Digitaria exilis]